MLSGTKHRNITAKRQYSRCIPNMADAYVQCNGHLRPATDSCCWECIRKWKKSYLEEIAKKNGRMFSRGIGESMNDIGHAESALSSESVLATKRGKICKENIVMCWMC